MLEFGSLLSLGLCQWRQLKWFAWLQTVLNAERENNS